MTRLGLYNTLLSVVIGESVFALPFSLLLLRGYIDTIPLELTDAARVDGASQLQAFRYVALPLLKPALATVALFSTISTWNGFCRSGCAGPVSTTPGLIAGTGSSPSAAFLSNTTPPRGISP